MVRPLSAILLLSSAAPVTGYTGEFRKSRYELMARVARERTDWVLLHMMGMPVAVAAVPTQSMSSSWKSRSLS
jgi:hypothetical protein